MWLLAKSYIITLAIFTAALLVTIPETPALSAIALIFSALTIPTVYEATAELRNRDLADSARRSAQLALIMAIIALYTHIPAMPPLNLIPQDIAAHIISAAIIASMTQSALSNLFVIKLNKMEKKMSLYVQ